MGVTLKQLGRRLHSELKWYYKRMDGDYEILTMTTVQKESPINIDVMFEDDGITTWLSDINCNMIVDSTNPYCIPILKPYRDVRPDDLTDAGVPLTADDYLWLERVYGSLEERMADASVRVIDYLIDNHIQIDEEMGSFYPVTKLK